MSTPHPIQRYFARLGLGPEIATIYETLYTHGPQSLLQLARNAKLERTKLYRLLDTLTENQLIEIDIEYKRKTYRAAPIGNLRILLARKEQELQELQDELVDLQKAFRPKHAASALTHTQFYRGPDGVKQMFWNQTKAKSESLSLLFENIQTRTNTIFFERWAERCNQRGQRFRSLVGDHFLQSQRTWYARHNNQRLIHWQGRYLETAQFPITHSMVTYDDVISYFNWQDGEIFGIEIYNLEIAQTQRQFFELLWQQAKPMPETV